LTIVCKPRGRHDSATVRYGLILGYSGALPAKHHHCGSGTDHQRADSQAAQNHRPMSATEPYAPHWDRVSIPARDPLKFRREIARRLPSVVRILLQATTNQPLQGLRHGRSNLCE
jgi:hypothetical protein